MDALKSIITKDDKKLILKFLKDKPSLVSFVLFYGWEKEAKATLIAKIESYSGFISNDWLQAIVNLKDRSTYPALKSYFLNGWNRHATYNLIKLLPGMDLSKELPLAWENAFSKGSELELLYLTGDLLKIGYVPALEYTINQYEKGYNQPGSIFNPQLLLSRYLDFSGNKEETINWWKQNKNKIKFNNQRLKFYAE